MPGTEQLLKHLGLTRDAELMAVFTELTTKINAEARENSTEINTDEVVELLKTEWEKRLKPEKLSQSALESMLSVCNTFPTLAMSSRLTKVGIQPDEASLGESLLLPNGLFQVLRIKPRLFKSEQLRLVNILSDKELRHADLSALIPTAEAGSEDLTSSDNQRQAVNKLNQLIAKKKNGLWIGSQLGIAGISSAHNFTALANLLEEELALRKTQQTLKRKLFSWPIRFNPVNKMSSPGKNIIFKRLKFTTDAQFIAFCTNLTDKIPERQSNPNEASADVVLNSLVDILKSELKLKNFTLSELKDIDTLCSAWYPTMSERLIISGNPPTDYQIGDTLLLPKGIYQIQSGKEDNAQRAICILTSEELIKAGLETSLPLESTPESQEDYERDDSKYKQFVKTVNTLIAQKQQGLWIGYSTGLDSYNTTTTLGALKAVALEELSRRKHANEWSLFSKNKAKKPEALTTIPLSVAPPKPLAKQRLPIRMTKTWQPEDARSVEDLSSTMLEITQQLNKQTDATAGSTYHHRVSEDQETVEIYQLHPTKSTVIMTATSDSVTLYQPLFKEKKLSYADKAELCLKALGIPPLNGRDNIEIEGGSPKFRSAIMDCFEKLKTEEESVNIKHPR